MKALQTSRLQSRARSFRQGALVGVVLGGIFMVSHACSPVTRDITIVDSGSGGQGDGDGDGESGGSPNLGGQDGSGGVLVAVDCEDDNDCPGEQPFCDISSQLCRNCLNDDECAAQGDATPYCDPGGCVECKTNAHCGTSAPVCDPGGSCRGCESNDECLSDACAEDGSCVAEASAVFALAQTGSTSMDCGTRELPCRSLSTASSKLSEERSNLIFVPTNQVFNLENVALPADLAITIYGNDVSFVHSGDQPLVKQGGSLTLVGMNMSGYDASSQTLVTAYSADLVLRDSTLAHSGTAVFVEDGATHVEGCRFDTFTTAGVNMGCGAGTCSPGALVERSYFREIPDAVVAAVDNALIRNNVFDRIAHQDYARGVNLMAVATGATVAFNTFYRSGNCSFTGLVACDGDGATVIGNLSVDSTIDHSSGPCYNQVYLSCDSITYALSETVYPGDTNITGDAMLADPENGDFRLLEGSDAIDAGPETDPNLPDEDYFGNPRPVGGQADLGAIEFQ